MNNDNIIISKNTTIDTITDNSLLQASKIIEEYTSPETARAYKGDITYIHMWRQAMNFIGKVTKKQIIIFIMQHVQGLDVSIDQRLVSSGYKKKKGPHALATIKRRLASLSVFLQRSQEYNPVHDKEIKILLSKLTKKYGVSKPTGKAITKYILDEMLSTCDMSKLIDVRDYALLLFGWGTGGRRRSEIVNADVKNLIPDENGGFTYNLHTSKTDKNSKGYVLPLKGKVAHAVSLWLTRSEIVEGYLFRSVSRGGKVGNKLTADCVYSIVAKRLQRAGYNKYDFCAHSLRSGFITESGRRNKPIGDVMAMTTHKSLETFMKYYQAGSIINNSAACMADE